MSKKEKTIDELLEEALVPEDEQKYKIPNNWVWTKFGAVAKLYNGYAFKSTDYQEDGIPIIRISDISSESTTTKRSVKVSPDLYNERFLVRKNDLLIAMSGATTGKTGIYASDEIALQNQRVGNIKEINNTLLYFKFKNYYVFNNTTEILNKAYGGAQPNISGKLIESMHFPLPPLNEQKRIAEKVERLLGKVDEAKRLIDEAMETFELRRAAILDKAFRGGNTRVNENLPNGWSYKKFNEVARVNSKLVNPLDYLEYPHIAPDNIEKHTGKLLDYRTIREDNVKSNKHYFEKDSILYSKIRPYLSKVVIADFEGLCSADMYPIETQLENEYLYWYMLSPMFLEQATTAGSRSVLPKINQKELGEILVPICNMEEQKNTINFIKSVMNEESIILESLNDGLIRLNQLSEAILSKAFKSELGTHDLNDEPAIEMLKSVLKKVR